MYDNNNASNQTVDLMAEDACPPHITTTAERVGKIIAYIIILVISFSGNTLIIYVVCKSKNVQRNVNYLILNMAVSDLFTPVIVIPKKIVHVILDINDIGWLLTGLAGEITCKLVHFVQDLAVAVSILTLVLIALERFVAVTFPLRAKMITSRLRVTLIMSTWIIGAALHAPYLYTFKVVEFGSEAYCIASWEPEFEEPSTGKFYTTFLCITLIIIPFALLVAIYTIIVLTLIRQRNTLRDAVRGGVIRDKMNRNVLKMAVTIVVVFAICWGPLNIFIFVLIFVWNWEAPLCALGSFPFIAEYFAHANTAINPCVYFGFVENYRRSLRNVLTGSFLHTSVREAGNRLNVRRETFELTTISRDRASSSDTKAAGVQMVSSKRLNVRCESKGTITETL
ncbi:QRFP-like peptide receptor [Oculina patagonica]